MFGNLYGKTCLKTQLMVVYPNYQTWCKILFHTILEILGVSKIFGEKIRMRILVTPMRENRTSFLMVLTWENISPKRIFILVWCDVFENLDKNGCIFLWYYNVKLNFRKGKYSFFTKNVTFLKFDSSLGENFSQGYFDFIPGFTVSL